MKKTLIDILLYFVVFMLVQIIMGLTMAFVAQGGSDSITANIIGTLASSVITIVLFARLKWVPYNGDYINTRPWFTLFWVVCLSIGTIIPLQLAQDALHLSMPESYNELLKGMLSHKLGFVTIGIVAPMAEEMVFRGAILRALNQWLGHRMRWVAIILSALLFGVVHGNMAQGFGAFAVGLILGWMYIRTGSIVPGVVLHWTNNMAAVVAYRLMPQTVDMTVVEYFHGDMGRVALAALFSLMIFGAALYQLNLRLSEAR